MDDKFLSILDRCLSRRPTPIEDCIYLLDLPEDSEESGRLIDATRDYVMESTDGIAEIAVQIGVVVGPCYADCGFCNFACSTTRTQEYEVGRNELSDYLKDVTSDGLISEVSLMTINNFDFDTLIDRVELARSLIPEGVRLCINTGDLDPSEAKELKTAGADYAYHAIRLGEGIDNALEPYFREMTIRNLIDAGISVATGVEPIGPEHSSKDLAHAFYHAMELGCSCCSASAREPVPGTRMYSMPAISQRRLEQIRSAFIMSSTSRKETELGFYGGFYGGMNRAFCEYAGSPKDTDDLSEKNMGHTVQWAKEILKDQGYTKIRAGYGSLRDLD